ncbi:hypothetical protein HMI54_008977, partial [Coelomomyces lativittatus]
MDFHQLLTVKASLDQMYEEYIEPMNLAPNAPNFKDALSLSSQMHAMELENPTKNPFLLTDWETIQPSEFLMESINENADTSSASTSFLLPKWFQSSSTKLNEKKIEIHSVSHGTQTDLPQDEGSQGMLDRLYHELLQKNSKLRQLEQENEHLTQQCIQLKTEQVIQLEKECTVCSQRLSESSTVSLEKHSQWTALLEQSQMESQLDRKEKVYWKKECEKLRSLVDALETELSIEKSNMVRFQQQQHHLHLQQQSQPAHQTASHKDYVNDNSLASRTHAENEELTLKLEKAHSQIRILQSTVHQLSELTTDSLPNPTEWDDGSLPKPSTPHPTSHRTNDPDGQATTNEWMDDEETHWKTFLETGQRLEMELKDLQYRREMLQAEYVKIPLAGVQNRRRKEELDAQLDSLDQSI